MAMINAGEPITREYVSSLLGGLQQQLAAQAADPGLWGQSEMLGSGAINNDQNTASLIKGLQANLMLMDRYGVNSLTDLPQEIRSQLPGGGTYVSNSPNTLGDQFKEFVTHPAFLLAAGGVAGVAAGGASAAGAGSSAGSSGYGAAWEGLGGLSTGGSAAGGAGTAAASTLPAGSFQTASANTGTMTDVGTGGLFEQGGAELGGVGGAEEAGLAAYTNTGAGGAIAPTTGAYQFPYGDVLKGALSLYLSNQQSKNLQGVASNAAALSDPFAAQRPQYQQQFSNLTTNPSSFFEDPAIARIIAKQQKDTASQLSSRGYNMSGNLANAVAETGMDTAFKQYMPYADMIGKSAGAFQGTQGAGAAYAGPAVAANTAQGRTDAGTLAILEQIFRGQQPTSAQQATGTPKNQNALEGIFSL